MMHKYLFPLAVLAGFGLGAAPAPVASHTTPWGLLVEAGRLPAADSPRCTAMEYRDYPPYSKKWWDLVFESEQQNTEQFHLLRESRLLMQSNGGRSGIPDLASLKFPAAPTEASVRAIVAPLNSVRNLANIVSDGALFSHLNGNDTEGVGRMLDELNMANCLRQCHTLIAQLVSAGFDALGDENIEVIAPSLRLSGPSAAETRKEILQVIDWLLDERPSQEAWRKSFAYEIVSSEHPSRIPGATTQPIPITIAQVEHDLPLLNKACEFQNLATSLALVKQCTWPGEFATMDRIFITEFRILADRRMAAIDLAIQLYRVDHHGDWPKTLDQLVPTYLPRVPRDPFRTDSAPIGYKIIPHGWPDGKDRPVLFAEAGPDIPIGPEARIGWYNQGHHPVRHYRDLTLPTSKKF